MMAGFTHRLNQELQAFLKLDRFSKLPLEKFKFYKPNYYANIISWVGGLLIRIIMLTSYPGLEVG